MSNATTPAPAIDIRLCHSLEEFEACVRLEKTIWGSEDLEVVPSAMFVVTAKTGGQVIGAFDRGRQIGFTYAVPAFYTVDGRLRPFLHSHMTAVLPEYQDAGVGRRLKLFQRQEALSRGINLVEWTFDPLEIRNAHFNLNRLGAIVRRFLPNAYGITSSPLHSGMPTDRLVAEWHLNSPRVQAIVAGRPAPPAATENVQRIALPAGIAETKRNNPAEAVAIQSRLRAEFQHWLARGHAVTAIEQGGEEARYVLQQMKDA